MQVIVDEMVLNLMFIFTLMFFGGLGVFVVLAMKCPRQVWTIINCWLSKKVLDISATSSNSFRFMARTRREEGQLQMKKGNFTSIKVQPTSTNPLFIPRYHLEGTGIPTVLSSEAKCIAVNPETLTAVELLELKEHGKLPKALKEWMDQYHLPLEVVVVEEGKPPRVNVEYKSLVHLNPTKLLHYFDGVYDENQFTHMLEEKRLEGQGLKPKSAFGGKAIPIGIILIFVFVFIWLLTSGVLPI